uniref:Transforming growth factor beta receptor 3 n=1 Tax=Vombatus ursinus TaxID=29139 RepID=A0A4X2JWU8_VOMUR
MASQWMVTMLGLMSWCLATAGPVPWTECVLSPVNSSHPVQALLESFTVLSGCASRGTTSLPQEVHVLNLRNPDEGPGQPEREITLHLKPISSVHIHQKSIVFLLNSPQPLIWKLKTERLAPGVPRLFFVTSLLKMTPRSKCLSVGRGELSFSVLQGSKCRSLLLKRDGGQNDGEAEWQAHVSEQVSEGSVVEFPEGNFSLSAKTEERSFPHGNVHLLQWAQKEYGAVTSFTELKISKNVYIKVGEDQVFPPTCHIEKNFLSLNYLAGYLQPKMAEGCIMSSLPHGQEVHIIELITPNSNPYSSFQVDIVIDIRPFRKEPEVVKHLVLILKCKKSVNWVIKSYDVQGSLKVIAPNSIGFGKESERSMVMTKSIRNDIPSTQENLVKWAFDNGYSPVTSYTMAPVANRFHLWLENNEEMSDEEEHSTPPELQILLGGSPLPSPENPSFPGGSFPFPFPPINRKGRHEEKGEDGFPRPKKPLHPTLQLFPSLREPQEAQRHVDIAFSVSCDGEKMLVAIEKDSLQANGYTGTELSLSDPTCKAKMNGSHFILESSLKGCGTQQRLSAPDSVVYYNSIIMQVSAPGDSSGWPTDYEDLESGNNGFPGDVDEGDSFFISRPEIIVFNCSLRHTGTPDVSHQPQVQNITFNMELYDTDLFLVPVSGILAVAENGHIYVEVSVTKADQDVGFAIQTCFISPYSNSDRMSDYAIIENICPKDESVRFYSPQKAHFSRLHTQMDKKRFSFMLKPVFNTSLLFLQCELTLCTKKEEETHRLPKCIPPDEACTSLDANMIWAMMQNKKTFTKPLVVIYGDKNEEPTIANPVGKSPPILPGLDTLTVMGIAFAAFVIGALLMGALWYIYSHTGELSD